MRTFVLIVNSEDQRVIQLALEQASVDIGIFGLELGKVEDVVVDSQRVGGWALA